MGILICSFCEEKMEKEMVYYCAPIFDIRFDMTIHKQCFFDAGGQDNWLTDIPPYAGGYDYHCRFCNKEEKRSYFGIFDYSSKKFACFCLPCAKEEFGANYVSP